MESKNKPHLILAFEHWKKWLTATDTVIDATCGNGKDTLRLASLVPEGKVLALDIQKDALTQAKKTAPLNHVSFFLQSHISFPPADRVKLIVYNLGYLPWGNKALTTLSTTTLQSLEEALKRVSWGGAVSVTCYPGHTEGALEEKAVFAYARGLDPLAWKVSIYQWKETSPSFIWIEKL